MCFTINSSTSGMNNLNNKTQTNLFNKATELSKDNNLSDSDIKELEKIASSDNNLSGEEQLFLQGLQDHSMRNDFVKAAKESNFDPSGFSFSVGSKLEVQSGTHKIKIEFADTPPPNKQVVGDLQTAKDKLLRIIPENKRAEWENTNKHNVNSVKNFLNSLNLNTEKKVEFVQAYMTSSFNHPGIDINWGGANLQEGINSVPSDGNGRKYIDCEAFVKLGSELLGSDKVKEYSLASGNSGDKRDHQVAIFKSGNDAYVISNNEITKVNSKGTPESMIKEAHPDFDKITKDLNGAMKADTGSYKVGETITTDDGGTISIESITNATKMIGKMSYPDGNSYHVEIKIDEETGDYSYQTSPKKGDVFVTDNQTSITVGDMPKGVATLPDGTKSNVNISVSADGFVNFN